MFNRLKEGSFGFLWLKRL